MKRMNLRDVPDDVYAALVEAAAAHRQSLSGYVVARLTEVAQLVRVADYLAGYQPPQHSGVRLEDAVAAVREVREAS
jgi:uncharacterized protein (DUF1778 family)